jgi:F-type H+-transporting ATPase subunit b
MNRYYLAFVLLFLPAMAFAATGGEHGYSLMGFVWRVIVFAVFVFILFKVLKKPLLDFLNKRTEDIENAIENAQKAKEEAEVELTNYKLKLKQMESELETMKERSRKQAEAEKEKIVSDASESAEKLQKSTENMINSELEKAKAELKKETAKLAFQLAEKKIEKQLDDDSQKKLIKNYISKIGVTN